MTRDTRVLQVTSTAIDGSLVYSGTDDGSLELRDINREDNLVIRTNIHDGKVYSISLIKCFDIVLVAGETGLHFYRPSLARGRWRKLRSDFILSLGTNKHLSVFGPRFCAADSQAVVNVFEIFYVGQIVRTSLICEIKQVRSFLTFHVLLSTSFVYKSQIIPIMRVKCHLVFPPQEQQKWVQWKLWREKMIGMNSNGEILVYSLLSQFGEPMYKSEPYTVVLYKNPSWIFR